MALIRPPSLLITELALPIFVVTTENRPPELARARTAGADALLVKPASFDTIQSRARELLARVSSSLPGHLQVSMLEG